MKSALLMVCLAVARALAGYSRVSTNGEARARDILDLRPGEAVDHPSTARYSTLDKEMLAALDARTRAQERFHPPASFEHALAHAAAQRPHADQIAVPSDSDITFSKPVVTMTYDFPPTRFEARPKPSSAAVFPAYGTPDKIKDSYASDAEMYGSKPASFHFDHPPKSLDYPGHYEHGFEEGPTFVHDPYDHGEIIFDHLPEDHHFHHYEPPTTTTTTMEPEMMDQRVNKRPYSYYYIGKKLWYLPLYFSIYFIIYIAALVLKSVARHKINFPVALANAAEGARSDAPSWMDYVTMALEGIEKYATRSSRASKN